MKTGKSNAFSKCLLVLVCVLRLGTVVSLGEAEAETSLITIEYDEQGVNVTVKNRFEFYFNRTNGSEITRYYDLRIDPLRTTNLVLPANQSYQPPIAYSMWPLFSSAFYSKYTGVMASTGRDGNAALTILGQDRNYVILQSTSRIMTPSGGIFKDIHGNTNYINSTWLIRSDGYIFLKRTLYTPTSALIPQGYRWYPFYLVRTKGFTDEATFYLFNTTHVYTYTVSEDTYQNNYTAFPKFPIDKGDFFGIASPFLNATLGGDGTNNIVLVYKFDEEININEWRSDNYHGRYGTEFGPTHEFDADFNMSTHTYHAMIHLTNESISEQNVMRFAGYFSENFVFPLIKTTLTTNKSIFAPGDLFSLNTSGESYYNIAGVAATLTIANSMGAIWYKSYSSHNVSEGQIWSDVPLMRKTVPLNTVPDNYTITFRLVSNIGIPLASDSKTIFIEETV